MRRDRLGRRRRPGQERGLRPIHPPLPHRWLSKALRVAMSPEDWARFEALAQTLARAQTQTQTQPQNPTQPQNQNPNPTSEPVSAARAFGLALSALMESSNLPALREPAHWMDWEQRKTLRLLRLAV